ncbi:FHA domain-containing protein [Streptomyces radicis]|uniref:FHA domain-containing protein n=1 Tax=Streptomyces radicis TaxID=1750517 RepID=A0A3A9W5E5_9ACTN|nr:FHA domain-containing protein [Streptomyces radicis]RKN07922.1 FHA domain-containing protein [Streptomyces radicis]RKN20790.1 FHA domain-containing protein [Streptomyces radicis]
MQIRLTVLGHGDAEGGTDVQVTAPDGTPLDAVLGTLATTVAPGASVPAVVFCEDRRLDPRRTALGSPPLVDGAVLAFHRPLDAAPVPAQVPATVLVVAGPDAGGVHLLRGGEARVGRSAEADVPLDDPDVSRTHCAIALHPDGSVTVTDLGSTNGTLLDGAPVRHGPVPVRSGALLRIGESVLRVVARRAAPPPVPPRPPAQVPAQRGGGRRGLAEWARERLGGAAPEAAEPVRPAPGGAVRRGEAAEARWPDLAAVLLMALDRGPRLWERGAAHPDAFTVRLGAAQQAPDVLPPVTVSLTDAGSLGLVGPRERLAGVARAVVAQLAASHPPGALELVALAPGRADAWSWLGWLPHVRPERGQDCSLLLGFDARQVAARLRELTRRLGVPGDGRRTVVLVDGDPGGADTRAALDRLAAEGPAAGIHLLVLAEAPSATASSPLAETLAAASAAVPALRDCGTVGVLTGPVATALRLVGAGGVPGPTAGADAVSPAWAERFARALAPVREDAATPPPPSASALPESCRLLDALELARVTPGALRERWARRSGLPLVLGTAAEGPLALDLAEAPGPVAVEGAPGSGRTELLSALAASLATGAGPGDLSLLLVEGAGEGLRPCAELPHVTSYVGATDPVRMRAFTQALRDELKRRAAVAAEGGPGGGVGALPWLAVLVDDFDALTSPPLGAPGRPAAGSVVRALDAVVQDGHTLRVRLIVAGALPGAAIRLALTGGPVGRAELRRPSAPAVPFQAGRVTARIPRTSTLRPTVTRLDWARAGDPPARRPVRELGNGPTDVALLASAAARAARGERAATPATLV